ncbi:hypothetical protein C1H46_002348 [Malus baccata]|uniref:Uncharacterized protein n=1 Tax=Malus baccata TaxID=106549 RepID=A0A540NLQ1_MALBA|nr:hypothetical protein C1H46_002348 [Malus baccata]
MLQSLAMHHTKILCRVPVYPPARVLPTPPPSRFRLLVPAVLFVAFHELCIDSWLLSFVEAMIDGDEESNGLINSGIGEKDVEI